jgi:hypothetical protein
MESIEQGEVRGLAPGAKNCGATVLAMAASKPAIVRYNFMARPNYSGEKRRKELEKQRKKEEKKRRKLENASVPASSEETSEAGEPTPGQPTVNVG